MQTVKITYFRPWVQLLPNGRMIELAGDYPVMVGSYHVTAPKGFQTDFASIPRAFWAIIPPMGLHSGAAIIHDYLYVHHSYVDPRTGTVHDVTRKEADVLFLMLMLYSGVSTLRAWTMYRAVRLFGKKAWNRQGWPVDIRKQSESSDTHTNPNERSPNAPRN